MPQRTDLHSILIIGAGPIVIGQACEFDYSGVQACRALREEGYRVILINSNPATIMTDPEMADATYIEPITPAYVTEIIEREHPDAILPTMGGQTALNCALDIADQGVLDACGVEMIAACPDVIRKAENRLLFREAMERIGLCTPCSHSAKSLEEARAHLSITGLPAIIRPSFTLGGQGGGIAYTQNDFDRICSYGLAISPIHEVLVEESVIGWKEYEMEVIRDRADNAIIVCSIENVDPMGVHTGDSVTVAPALTLTDHDYQNMRDASLAVVREIGVETGGANVQFAVNPQDGRMVVIEMNPRVSRSSALASKATGFPIARVAAKLAVGYTLDELRNDITGGVTPSSFEPALDYIVIKIPRFTFEKFSATETQLTTSMKSVGEVMAIGRTFSESLQKALCSLEIGLSGFDEVIPAADDDLMPEQAILSALATPTPERILLIAQAFRLGVNIEDIYRATSIDPWFLGHIRNLVEREEAIRSNGLPKDREAFLELKKEGFSDARLAALSRQSFEAVVTQRCALGVSPVYKRVDSCAGEFPAVSAYLYSCYEGDGRSQAECEADPSDHHKVIILGGGPNRIGQGIEFDCCCVHATFALAQAGYETIMVNCNPETVSTDPDTADRLYFEPLTEEAVIGIVRVEQRRGHVRGVIVQLGGQTPLKLARALEKANIPILGTSPDSIALAENRNRFHTFLQELGLKQPCGGTAHSAKDIATLARGIGFPVIVRPSFVLGGRAMEVIEAEDDLQDWLRRMADQKSQHEHLVDISEESPVLIDQYVSGATEVDVDAIRDNTGHVYIAGVMEHIEEAGVHSGDSACCLPPHTLPHAVTTRLEQQATRVAEALGVCGLINVQFAVKGENIYILEVNPRASRTVPFVSKATRVPVAHVAAQVMVGQPLSSFDLQRQPAPYMSVKEAVFPFARFPNVDIILGPEMKSTGEVMGTGTTFDEAFAKSQLAAGVVLPDHGTVFMSVREADKAHCFDLAQGFESMGFTLLATHGTATFLQERGLSVMPVNKVREGSPHCVDFITSGNICMVINTTKGKASIRDSFTIRRVALTRGIAYYTTIAGSYAALRGVRALKEGRCRVLCSVQDPARLAV